MPDDSPETALQVFDRPMCCATGVCGPEVDPALARFAADLESLRSRGITVRRFNPAQEPGAFVRNRTVHKALEERGTDCLPLVLCGDTILASGSFPDREALLEAVGLPGIESEPERMA
jgi:hypothetical protein